MATKFFHFDGGVQKALEMARYVEGAPVEYHVQDAPTLAIQGWHGIPQWQRAALIAKLVAAGWREGAQSKLDSI